jgi:phosphoserine phosphatase
MALRHIDSDALLPKLDAAWRRAGPEAVIATDGDGTLWAGDIGQALFDALLAERGVREAADAMLRREAARFDIDLGDATTPSDVAGQLLAAYRAGRYAEDRAFAMMAWAFAGWSLSALTAFTREVLDVFGFEAAVREELKPVLSWAREEDVPVWLVSASPQCAVLAAADVLSIPPERTLSMEPARRDAVLEAKLAQPATYGPGKMLRLSTATGGQPIVAAFGDSSYDLEMLHAAEIPVAVYPAASLAARLGELTEVWILGGD